MTNYSVILQRFLSEFRNGSDFLTNPTTDYNVDLKANVGELCKLTQTIEISVSTNISQTYTIQYNATGDATYGNLVATGVNWLAEGYYTGAVINLFWGGNAGISVTVGLISGTGFNTMQVTKAALITAGIIDGEIRVDFATRLTSVPDTLIYKYGLNPNGSTYTNYLSWLDGTQQAYYISNLTGSLQTMIPVGLGNISWNVSDSVQAKYDATVSTYYFQFTVEHIFRVPYYVEGEIGNIQNGTQPLKFDGTESITYDNGWFFGGTTLSGTIKAELKGGIGQVGYFLESYNGFTNNYEVQNVAISNSDGSDVLEGTLVNTLTFQLKKNSGNWTAGTSKVILYHSKLPTSTEYSNKPTAYDTLWIFERLVTEEGDAPLSGTILTNYEVVINADPTILDVTVEIQYTSPQQDLILNTSDYLVWVTVGGRPVLDPDDRISLPVNLDQFSKDLDVTWLVTSSSIEFFEPFEFDFGVRRLDTWTGWNGDLGGCMCSLRRITTVTNAISKAQFKIYAQNGTDEFELLSINVPIGKIQTVNLSGESYQILNADAQNSFNLPGGIDLNRIRGTATVPGAATGHQDYVFTVGFQTPWREWINNPNVPNSFFDSAETENNQNYRTSNYSNVDSYEIFPCWEFTFITDGGVETIYRKMTLESNVYDFDTNDATFSAVTEYYDEDGNITNNIFVDQHVLIVMEFAHTLGTITQSDIEAYIWIERYGSTVQPWFLHSSLDFTNPLNPLMPSDILNTGNAQFVEVFSANNLIVLRCYTNKDNLQNGVNYNVYGRIKNKTIA